MTQQNCSRCGEFLARPLPENAYYVTHSDFAEREPTTVFVGIKLTPKLKQHVDALDRILDLSRDEIAATITHPDAPDRIEYTWGRTEADDGTVTANILETTFRMDAFEEVEVDSPQVVHGDNDIVRVEERTEHREVQKTGVVCPDCRKTDDEVHWGPDA